MRMTTTLSGDFPELQKKLAGLSGINRSALMKDVAEGLRSTTMDRFRSRKSPEGKPWPAPLREQEGQGITPDPDHPPEAVHPGHRGFHRSGGGDQYHLRGHAPVRG
ncbi:MAG: phage virion morphogenesis protein [Enterocloster sp.]